MFAVSAFILVIGNFVFMFFAKFEIQPWNGDHDPKAAMVDRRASAISRRQSLDPWGDYIESRRGSNYSRRESIVPEDFDHRRKSIVIRDERFDPRGNVFGPSRRESLASRRPSVSSV